MSSRHKVISIRNDLEELQTLNASLEEFFEDCELPLSHRFEVNLALDELVTNIISYGFKDGGEHNILIILTYEGEKLTVRLEDDGTPFDPTAQAAPDTQCRLEERTIGGLGIHLVRNLVGEMRYERKDGRNILTMSKSTAARCAF